MKKLLLSVFLVASLTTFVRSQNGTCTPPIGVDCVTTPMFIDSVWTTAAVTDFTNDATDCNAQDQNYQDYQNKIVRENANDAFVLHVGLNPNVPAYVGVWIDWNDDLTFGNGELMYLSSSQITHTTVVVNVPQGPDTVIMRVRCANVSMGPCDSVTSGETEDYRVVVIDASGINEQDQLSWNFYPNPASDALHISLPGNTEAEISIVDLQGNVVRRISSKQKNVVLDVADLAAGMYFIRFESGSISETRKFVH
ncbi:MAG TPA: T9SS type A sorting domain-containing protein [Bacteroidia bacterium]|jgi:hypothetical protein|nr:T9SS type A sorting domain-containing protein [Bacteroidia bacterium]